MLILASFALIALPYLFGKNAETKPRFHFSHITADFKFRNNIERVVRIDQRRSTGVQRPSCQATVFIISRCVKAGNPFAESNLIIRVELRREFRVHYRNQIICHVQTDSDGYRPTILFLENLGRQNVWKGSPRRQNSEFFPAYWGLHPL